MQYEDHAWVQYATERIPLKRSVNPSGLNGAIVSLASDASAYVTEQKLRATTKEESIRSNLAVLLSQK